MKKTLFFIATLLIAATAFAQLPTGGVKGTVVDRQGRVPIGGAKIALVQGGDVLAECTSDAAGAFEIGALANGVYEMRVTAEEFSPIFVNVTVDKGFVKDMHYVTMTAVRRIQDVDDSSFTELDLDDSGYNDTPTILFTSNDIYNNVAGYGFSAIRFKNRGYNSETQDVYLSGVKLNDAITGYSPYSLWSGLNEATRSKETTIGTEVAEVGLGGYNGTTNIYATPSTVRKGWRYSILTNSSMYRLRLMGTYASGEQDNGISYAVNASVRAGGNDWIEGIYYRNFALYAGIEKNFDDVRRLSLVWFATPGQRGAQNASTQEVYNLMGDNMYNSNWGYQNGRVRNARVRKTFEPVTVLHYSFTPNQNFETEMTLLWRTGRNGYTALDWYDAADPRPDYYRNLPSYAYMEDEDYNRTNEEKYRWAVEMWSQHVPEYANYQHLNWDRMYNVNYNSTDGRSKYALEERHVDQNDLNFASNFKWTKKNRLIRGGISGRWNRTENYKLMNDLLGGQYYLNIDSFAERDFASSEALIQNDLDYYFANGSAEKILKGGKYGYDYFANVRRAEAWLNGSLSAGPLSGSIGGSIGYTDFWREGLLRKGLFAGLDENGNEIYANGVKLTGYDAAGRVITSKGSSDTCSFIVWSAKANLAYTTKGSRLSVNAGIFNEAPTFNQAFVSPRTRNTIVPNLTPVRTMTADINWQYSNEGIDFRITGFYTKIMNQTDVMSFYDDSQNSFTNFAMSGIDQRHMGIELGARVPMPVEGLTLSVALSSGEYIYTSTPMMTQTIDNSVELIVDNQPVTYWKSHPIYKKDYIKGGGGAFTYATDEEGNYIIAGEKKHYVPSTPQTAFEMALNYRLKSYWFFELNAQSFSHSYLDMNPLYRTEMACGGADGVITPAEVEYMAAQEEFPTAFLVNGSVGKSWYIQRKYNIGFSLELKNMLNNTNVRTGGYEQTRLISSVGKDRYYRFDPKYFYMAGASYMLNIYFRF